MKIQNIENVLVRNKTAILAKEKGFNVICDIFINEYYPQGTTNINSLTNYDEVTGKREGFIAIPTQSLLQKWLREVHNIYINANVNFFKSSKKLGHYYTLDRFDKDNIHDGKDYDEDQIDLLSDKEGFKTYEEALEIGLQRALNLINNE